MKTVQEQGSILYPRRSVTVDYVTYTIDPIVYIDKERVLQVVHNLINNAIKNSSRKRTVHVVMERKIDELRVSVQDFGSGITLPTLMRLFQPFSQSDTQYATGGTGLGLFIVKNIVLSHGGKIEIETRVKYGSIFTVTFPTSQQSLIF